MSSAHLQGIVRHLRRAVNPHGEGGLTDDELLERFVRTRDEAAFEVLVWRHGPMVLGVCRRLLRREQDAEDAFQATFLTFVRKAGAIGKRPSVGSWLYKVAYRVALAAQASAAVRARREVPLNDVPAAVPDPTGPDIRPVLDEEVNGLPEKYRAPFVLCYLEGQTNEQAARQLGCPTGTVATRLAWARQRLRARLVRRGLALPAAFGIAAIGDPALGALSAALVESTIGAALTVAAGRATTVAVSAQAAALTEGVLRAMFLTKVKTTAAVVLSLGLLGVGGSAVTYRTAVAQQAAGGDAAPQTTPREGATTPSQDKVGPVAASQNPDLERRLQRVEEKLDRVLTPREVRDSATSLPPVSEATLKALIEARDKVEAELEAKELALFDLRRKSPFMVFHTPNGHINLYTESLARIDGRRNELKVKRAELSQLLQVVRKALADKGPAEARYLIAASGVKIALFEGSGGEIDRQLFNLMLAKQKAIATLGEAHPQVREINEAILLARKLWGRGANAAIGAGDGKAHDPNKPAPPSPEPDSVESYIKAMEAEVETHTTLIQTLNDLYDKEMKASRELSAYESHEAALRQEVKRFREMLDTLSKLINDARGTGVRK